jgi:hypothetical protein
LDTETVWPSCFLREEIRCPESKILFGWDVPHRVAAKGSLTRSRIDAHIVAQIEAQENGFYRVKSVTLPA